MTAKVRPVGGAREQVLRRRGSRAARSLHALSLTFDAEVLPWALVVVQLS